MPDMLGDDLEAWLAESALMKRTFRTCAIISGLIARRFTGEEKTRRQVLFSTDLIYDVLRKHQPDHVLLRAARADAATGLLDIRRLSDMLLANQGSNHPQGTRPDFAARGAGDAGNRPRSGLWRSLRRVAGGGRRGTGQRSDWIEGDWTDRDGTRRNPWTTNIPPCARLATVDVAGVTFIADLSGALFWEEQRLLVVSDLHLEKGSSFAARGVLLPPYDTVATLGRLAAVIARHDPRMVIALGDSFHDRDAHGRLSASDRDAIAGLQVRRDWIWISGNHDPALPSDLGGVVASEVAIGPIAFRHEPTGAAGEIAGHLHPKARLSTRGRSMERRCFASDGERAVMPAFGAYAGGLSIRDAAFAKIFQTLGFVAHVLGDRSLHAIAASRCY